MDLVRRKVFGMFVAIVLAMVVLAGCAAPAPTAAPSGAGAAAPTAAKAAAPTAAPSGAATAAPTAAKAAAPTAAPAGPSVTWKFAMPAVGPNGVIGQAYAWWGQEVEKRTQGRVKVQFFWSESLLAQKDMLTGLANGVADACIVGLSYFPAQNALGLVTEYPNNSSDPWALLMAIDELYDTNADIKNDLEKNGVVRAGGWTTGPFQLFLGSPFNNLAELKGKSIRSGGGARTPMWQKLGVNPVSMTSGELYDAMDRKVLYGFENTLVLADDQKHGEVVKTVVMENGGSVAASFIGVNKGVWGKLSDADRTALLNLRVDFNAHLAKALIDSQSSVIEKWKKAGITFVTPSDQDMATWKDAAAAATTATVEKQEAATGKAGKAKAAFDQFQSLLKKYEAQVKEKGYPWVK